MNDEFHFARSYGQVVVPRAVTTFLQRCSASRLVRQLAASVMHLGPGGAGGGVATTTTMTTFASKTIRPAGTRAASEGARAAPTTTPAT